MLNGNGEIKLGARKYPVDVFLASENAVYQFQGCYYHACPSCCKEKWDETHPYYPMTFREVHEHTQNKTTYLRDLGYTVYEKWECEWREENKKSTLPPVPKELSQAQVLEKIRTEEIFGLAKVDILTPDWLKPRLAEFPPIFKNCEVGRKNLSPFMREYCEKAGALKQPSRLLISSYYASHILLITPLLKYYLRLGLEVTKVHYVVEFPDHKPCFQTFADNVCNARRKGDQDPNSDILANTFKLVGNSAYGRICMNKAKQTDTVYANGTHATSLITGKRFKVCRRIGEDLFEVESYKKKHVFDLPLHLGVFTYQYAKLRMLQWQYDFMQKYLSPTMYELSEMDTDSSYFGLAKPTLEECVFDSLRYDFYMEYDQWFPSPACDEHKDAFVQTKMSKKVWAPFECCKRAQAFNKRTPGKFKFEFEGDGIVALCSKTYICWGHKETKVSCKGLQKKRNMERLTKQKYLEVLQTQKPGWGINKGFRAHEGRVFTYAQKRFGLSYMYCKRHVNNDGVSTEPLDL